MSEFLFDFKTLFQVRVLKIAVKVFFLKDIIVKLQEILRDTIYNEYISY
jgi:hypothetical protein